jgi:drug/metabolite transporter (DMT)-like permease
MLSFLSLAELAALSTALSWAFTAIFFTEAGKRIGSMQVNLIRLLFAVGCYALLRLILTGEVIPHATLNQTGWLTVSALAGLVIGDSAGFASLLKLGPRVATLILATHPILTAILGYFYLGENIGLIGAIGIGITMLGVLWVTSSRQTKQRGAAEMHAFEDQKRQLRIGITYAIIGASGQAIGFVLSKHALQTDGGMEPFDASMIRMLAAVPMLWIIAGVRQKLGETLAAFKDSRAMLLTLGGAFCGPFMGVWMSLVAASMMNAGIAATLNATTPLLILPVVAFVYKERITKTAFFGALLTVAGVTLLVLYK